MTEYKLTNLDGSTMGWLVITKQGFRYVHNTIGDKAASAIMEALKRLER